MAITKIGTPELFDFSATNTALQLPTGDTASRPSAPSAGEWRFNSELKYVEYYDGAAWFQIDTEAPANPDDFPSQNFNVNTYFGNKPDTQTIDAKFNEAANFNGSSSKIVLPTTTFDTIKSNGAFAVSAWFNTSTTGTRQFIFSASQASYLFLEVTTGNQLKGTVSNSAGTNTELTVSTTVTDGNWHHAVFTGDNGSLALYLDNGTPQTGSWDGTFFSGTGGIGIGIRMASSNYWNGKIDQVRLFDAEITSGNVASLYGETTTTAATLDFPAGAGCIAAYQLDGNGNDIPSTQTPTTLATYQLDSATTSIPNNTYPGLASNLNAYVTGKFGDAASFNGSNSKITLDNTAFRLSTQTISLWVNSSNYNPNCTLYDGGLDNNGPLWGGVAIGIEANKVYYYGGDPTGVGGSGFYTQTGTTALTNGNWVHIALVVNGTSITGYVNGSQDTGLSRTLGANIPYYGSVGFNLGVRSGSFGSFGWFNGAIDQVRIFNTALPQAAITSLYEETTTTAQSASITYQGGTYNGTTTNIGYTGLKFQPDFVWIKGRTYSDFHAWYDSVRGIKNIGSNSANQEGTNTTMLTSLDSNGFSLGTDAPGFVNLGGESYVAWAFKAGGAPTATNSAGAGNVPTSGSVMIDGVASTTALTGTAAVKKISANTAAGFSIVTFSNNASTANTFDHKLGGQPELVFIKGTDVSNDWFTYVDSLGKDKRLKLNSSDNVSNWISNDGTNTPTGINDTTLSFAYSATTYNFIAYLFRSIDKYQKIGSYTGTALSNNFVQTDFAPSFVLIKSSSLTSTYWVIIDSKRSSGTLWLYANTIDDEEGPYTNAALNSNGFTVDGNASYVNGSGETYIYLAIA